MYLCSLGTSNNSLQASNASSLTTTIEVDRARSGNVIAVHGRSALKLTKIDPTAMKCNNCLCHVTRHCEALCSASPHSPHGTPVFDGNTPTVPSPVFSCASSTWRPIVTQRPLTRGCEGPREWEHWPPSANEHPVLSTSDNLRNPLSLAANASAQQDNSRSTSQVICHRVRF